MFRRLFWDDYFVLFAVLFSLASAIVWQVSVAHDMFELMDVTANVELPGPTFFTDAETYFKGSLAVIILFYSTLWSIKISFLIFFKRLGKNVTRLRLLWWPTLIFTIVSYGISVGTIPFRCLVDSISYITMNCNSDSAIKSQRISLALNCALDVLTDCASSFLPLLFFF